ncbi:hypothetical protein MW887_007647 [Aspergillus wentii]|nr:hypothetical protein MW887_007647 [Aspergillus wentii]
MSRKAQIGKINDRQEKIDAAWDRFDVAQASRVAEIRRPATKVDVMSEDEYQRIARARNVSAQYFSLFSRETFTRDAGFRAGITAFFTDNYPDMADATARVAESLANSLIVYSQASSDPCFGGAGPDTKVPACSRLQRVPGYANVLENGNTALIEIAVLYLSIPYGSIGIETEILGPLSSAPSEFLLKLIEKDLEAGSKYPSEAEQTILKGVIGDAHTKQAFATHVKELFLVYNPLLQTLGSIVSAAVVHIPENSSPVPEDQFAKEYEETEKAVKEFVAGNFEEERDQAIQDGVMSMCADNAATSTRVSIAQGNSSWSL